MKFLFIVTSYWAYGELQIATDFAVKLLALEHKVMFLIPPSHVEKVRMNNLTYRTLIPNAVALNRILLHDIEDTFKPSYVVLSDFLNYVFCEKHYGLKEDDLSVFSGRIGAFDLYNFSLAGKKIDTYGFRSKEISKLNIDKYDFLLQPCPVNQLTQDIAPNCFRYRIFDGIPARTEDEYKNARTKLGIKSSEKLIVMTGAVWQSSFKPYAQVKEMVSEVDDVITQMIQRLPQNYKIVWVGPRNKEFQEGITQIHHIKSLQPYQFEMLVDSADVFVSTNYISTSMIRAALRGIPVALLGNSFLKRPGEFRSLKGHKKLDRLENISFIYPFRMFPVGWYSFLEPAVRENSFYKLTRCIEVFDDNEILEAVKSAASQSLEQSLDRLNKFKKEWSELSSIESIILSIKSL